MNDFDLKIPQINIDDVKRSIDELDSVVLLDVRTADEYRKTRIENSVNIPVNELTIKVEKIIPDKNAKIYVYCLSGSRSTIAVMEMLKIGYKNVFNMTGGMLYWRVKKFPELKKI